MSQFNTPLKAGYLMGLNLADCVGKSVSQQQPAYLAMGKLQANSQPVGSHSRMRSSDR